jgi:hypothetical protein
MNQNEGRAAGLSLVYEDVLPLRWLPAGHGAGHPHAHHDDVNKEFLHIVSVLEEQTSDLNPDDHGDAAYEMARIDAKLNLLLRLLGKLLSRYMDVPAALPFRLHAGGMQWTFGRDTPGESSPGASLAIPAPAQHIIVELYLRPEYPQPLHLNARVATVHGDKDKVSVEVTFCDLARPVQELLERTIFRRHRRMVAQARQGAPK